MLNFSSRLRAAASFASSQSGFWHLKNRDLADQYSAQFSAAYKMADRFHEPEPPHMYQISEEWEHNGRDDSDWFVAAYDPRKDEVRRVQVGTTRGGCCSAHQSHPCCYHCAGVITGPLPDDIREKATAALKRKWAGIGRLIETNRVMRPRLSPGVRVRTTKPVNNRPMEDRVEPCKKCDGSGKWINPRNPNDARTCFGCAGKAEVTRKRPAKKGNVIIPEGTAGVVRFVNERRSQYGTWSYGTKVTFVTDDGREVRADKDVLRLDEEPDYSKVDEQADYKARTDAYSLFSTGFVLGLVGSWR